MRSETSYPHEERDPIREDRQREAYFEALAAEDRAKANEKKQPNPEDE
tara:strand:+ start:1646 stop:1789 length:144 start_codon:yes stop_codon:yes gene_type:complete